MNEIWQLLNKLQSFRNPAYNRNLIDSSACALVGKSVMKICFVLAGFNRLRSGMKGEDSYLIDGVAINGVSGGPVFACLVDNNPQLLGTISAYMPNRIRGDALPGLLRSQDVTAFHDTLKTITSIDDAREKKEKEEAELKEKQQQRENEQPQPSGDVQPAKE